MTATAGTANPLREFRHTGLILDPQIGPLAEFPHPFTDRHRVDEEVKLIDQPGLNQ